MPSTLQKTGLFKQRKGERFSLGRAIIVTILLLGFLGSTVYILWESYHT